MGLGRRATPRRTGNRGDWDVTAAPSSKPVKPMPSKARSTLKPVSDKRAGRRPDREAVRNQRCALEHLGGCYGGIDTHEMVRTSQMSEARYMDDVTIGLCRYHHSTIDLYRLTAERYGVRIPRWAYEADPAGSVNEAGRLRVLGGKGTPYWWGDEERRRMQQSPDGRP